MVKGKPISPSDIPAARIESIPPEMFDAINELIIEKISGESVTIKQRDIVTRFCGSDQEKRRQVFDKGWLNFEEAYVAAGWKVQYRKASYNEDFDPYFTFIRNSTERTE